ncbi:MAG: YdeI/OmpD-associated family protein [Bacteroidales bacterium]|nr:YdeI/OmpD-associated family protein [Bacteroidales bacterium]
MNPKVDHYLSDGCGRCPLGSTPQCKVHNWTEELKQLRMNILDCGLTEDLKWGVPCYTFQKKNVLLLSAFKEYCSVGFFKGVLLKDSKGILTKPGENSQAVRQFRFTSVKEIIEKETVLKAFIHQAVEIEKAGLKINFKAKKDLIYPDEFHNKLDEIPALKTAFNALTPGRQRAYILYFSAPKQSETRKSRVEKCMPQILNGKGLNDQ